MQKPRISIVVAVGRDRQHNHVIGRGNELLWYIPDDLKRFKQLTLGHPVIMGRKTFESIVTVIGRPLPERKNIVISRSSTSLGVKNPAFMAENVLITNSLEDALAEAKKLDSEEIFIGGGSQIYAEVLPHVDRLYLTLIDDEKEGDSFFPAYETLFIKKLSEESREWNGLKYTWVDLERE